jgi:AraC-type DNA-binding domain-containing proteins
MGSLLDVWEEAGIDDLKDSILVTSCGYQKFLTKDFYISRPKGRLDYQVIYIVKGKGYYSFDDKNVEVSEGNIIIYSPHTSQSYSYFAQDKTELYWIHFTGFNIEHYLNKLNLLSNNIHYVSMDNQFLELFQKIINELQMKKTMFQYIIAGQFMELVSSFARKKVCLQSDPNMLISEDIQKVIEIMYKNYNETNSVEYYARLCNLSVYRFIHKFKQCTGVTPLGYITNIKINTAIDLIINSGFNISEISALVGYDNPLYFSRVFKKLTGICPSKYNKTRK